MEIKQINGNTDRVLRIAASPGKNVFHDKIVARLRAELKDGAVCIPHYGGKIVISPATKTVIVGGNSISYPKKMNPDEVAGLLNGAMREDFRGYRILCKDGLDDIKNLYESAIQ